MAALFLLVSACGKTPEGGSPAPSPSPGVAVEGETPQGPALPAEIGAPGQAQGVRAWVPAPGLKTRWASRLDPSNPLPEYPRPQLVRDDWVNLNGLWDFAVLPGEDPGPPSYQDQILVPFPVESALSGLAQTVNPQDRIWYRRTFSIPASEGRSTTSPATPGPTGRWILHFGAVDWEAEVFLNGSSLGIHRGGYDPFSFDITDELREGVDQELVVAVRDPTDEGNQPRGKQVLDPHGIWYTAVTGIWQTVWLEPVPTVHVERLEITPKLEVGTVEVEVFVTGSPYLVPLRVSVLAGDEVVATKTGFSGRAISISIPHPKPWSPADPFLYGLRVELTDADVVESYFGMRSIALGRLDGEGPWRLLLNDRPLFQYGTLDQGWWPDGLYTAPTDEALLFDVQKTKELGFNLIRKHVKVEPARWYYHCDREGILVWQDMPSGDNEGDAARDQFAQEFQAVVGSLRNHPSIIMWVPFNEGWGQHATDEYVGWLENADPTRLVNNASGWTDRGVGDVMDIHSYPGPGAPAPETISPIRPRAAVLGEFGGLGLPLAGHTWVEEDNWGYRSFGSLEELNRAYDNLLTQLRPLIGEGLAAAVYTQTTDVEVEVNGIMTYDREVVKLEARTQEIHRALHDPPPLLKPVVPTSRDVGQPWRFTTNDPGSGWEVPDFDEQGWTSGMAGFGTEATPGAAVRTLWDTPEIWIRRSFSLADDAHADLLNARLFLRIHHDEDAEVYLNGSLIAELEGYSTGYHLVALPGETTSLLNTGENTLAVHVRQTGGGQYIDVGIVEWIEVEGGSIQ